MKTIYITERHNGRKYCYEIELAANRKVGRKYYYKTLPSGAIYGADRFGLFVCYNYRVHGSRGGYPVLEIFRPISETRWKSAPEASPTTRAILAYRKEKCLKVSWGNQERQAHEVAKKQELRADVFGGEVHYCGRKPYSPPKTPTTSLCYIVPGKRTLEDIAREQKGQLYLY